MACFPKTTLASQHFFAGKFRATQELNRILVVWWVLHLSTLRRYAPSLRRRPLKCKIAV